MSDKIYGEIAKYYDITYKNSGRIDYFSCTKFLNFIFNKNKCKKILDVACGTGTVTNMMQKLGAKKTADLIKYAVDKCYV